MNKIINILISFITSLFVTAIYLPVKVSSSFEAVPSHNTRVNILAIFSDSNEACIECFNYEIRRNFAVTQIIVIFVVILLILNIIDKRRKNNE